MLLIARLLLAALALGGRRLGAALTAGAAIALLAMLRYEPLDRSAYRPYNADPEPDARPPDLRVAPLGTDGPGAPGIAAGAIGGSFAWTSELGLAPGVRPHYRPSPARPTAARRDSRLARLMGRLRLRTGSGSRRQWLAATVTIGALIVWFALLHPVALGGRTTYLLVGGESMQPLLHVGDLAVLTREQRYAVGDVVAYRVPAGHAASGLLIIHRIVGTDGARFSIRGDNVNGPDLWQPTAADIEGRMWFAIPNGGRLALLMRHPTVLPALLAALTVAAMVRRATAGPAPTGRTIGSGRWRGAPRAAAG